MMDMSGIYETLPEVEGPPKKVCAVCQAPADKSCGACHQIDYCSAEHQKSHWKEHKKDCPPIKIVSSPELGPHYVVTRDLPPWSLLITELPVLVNPYIILKDNPDIATCISCCSILPSHRWTCPQCSTPIFCNLACSMNKVHSEFECGVLSKCNKDKRAKLCCPPNLLYLRAIHLKNSDPETWGKVLELPAGNQIKTGHAIENNKWFIREILPLLGGKGQGFKADIFKFMELYNQNGFFVKSSETTGQGESQPLYLKGCKIAQSCFPNCTQIIGKGPKFQLQVRTTVELKKGTIPCIDLTEAFHSIGARQHQMHIRRMCFCPRCTDPTGTELGTMLSAVKCTQPDCKDGYLLPVNVRDMAENASWRCNGSACKGMCTWAEINDITCRFERKIITFKKRVPLEDVERTEEFWESLNKSLHPHHFVVRKWERKLIYEFNCQMERGARFTLPRMDLHISMIEDILKMFDIVSPGLSSLRAGFLALLFNGLNMRLYWSPKDGQKTVLRDLIERTIQAIDQLRSFDKLYPQTLTRPNTEYQMKRRGELQMALNSLK